MRLPILRSLLICALLTLVLPSWATSLVFRFKIVDDSNAVVPGSTIALNTVKSFAPGSLGTTVAFTTTSAGTVPYTTSGVAPVWNLTVNNINLSVLDLGNGDYGVAYDPEGANGEILLNFTITKPSGWSGTVTGANASISLVLTKDSSRILNADVASSTLATAAAQGTAATNLTAIKAKTDLIATNAADSANAATAQTGVTTLLTRLGSPVGASISADIQTRMATFGLPANFAALVISGGGTVNAATQNFPSTVTLSANDEQALTSLRGSYTVAGGSIFSSTALANTPTSGGSFPTNFSLLSIDGSGKVALQAAEHTAIQNEAGAGVLAATVDGGFTLKQCQALSIAVLSGNFTLTRNTGAKTITVVYFRPTSPGSTTTALATLITTYSDTALTIPTSRTVTFSNLP